MPHIVILGGGFAGTTVARELEKRFRTNDAVSITLISRTNYMVFTPMLAEVAGNSVEPRHATPPLRVFLKKTRFHQGEVRSIDLQGQHVTVEHADSGEAAISYDYLVLGLGGVTNYHHAPGAADFSYDLKSLNDAIRLRNHVLATLELADITPDQADRRALLTFLAAGGGYAGVEGLGQLTDFIHKALRFYPNIDRSELRFILASHGKKLLEQVDDKLGRYVVTKLGERGVDVRLGVSVTEVTTASATLEPGGVLPTCTVLWAAGIAINPLLSQVPLPKDKRGAIQVEPTLRVVGHARVFALGDCAAVPRGDGTFYAPTAQNALREGSTVAQNIAASIANMPLRRFRFNPIGSLASIGNYEAVAQVWNIPFSGLLAWFAWRAIYLFKLPDVGRKVRVLLDWILEFVLPTDIVQLPVQPSDDSDTNNATFGELRVATPEPTPGHTEVQPTAEAEANNATRELPVATREPTPGHIEAHPTAALQEVHL